MISKETNKRLEKLLRKYILIFFAVIVIILFFPWLFTSFCWLGLDFSDKGEIGDTIGGIIAPFVAIVAAALTFIAFWVQFKANEQQRNDIALERFEKKFYELLRIHRQNVHEMKIGTLEKRAIFQELYYELINCMIFINNIFEQLKDEKRTEKEKYDFYAQFNRDKQINLAYQIFFYGNTFNNVHNILASNKDIPQSERNVLEEKILAIIKKHNDNWRQGNLSITEKPNENVSFYRPYRGHSQLLGHYFRHLYQTVNFIDKETEIPLSDDNKYKYIKILRSQLSDYEQLILFYNAISDLGSPWFENGTESLIIKYKLIKNIPLSISLTSYPQEKISQIIQNEIEKYFECDERTDNNQNDVNR